MAIDIIARGIAAGKASLVDGKIPASQLPSYVDEIVEVENYSSLPETGEKSKIYVTKDNNKQYRWSGTQYTLVDSASYGIGNGLIVEDNNINIDETVVATVESLDDEKTAREAADASLEAAIENKQNTLTATNGIKIAQNTIEVSHDTTLSITDSKVGVNLNKVASKEYVDNIQTELEAEIEEKQEQLVSGTNIKTINGNSLLGSGNIVIQGGSGGGEYFAGNGLTLEDNTFSIDEEITATKEDVKEVAAMAEGKTRTFVLSYETVGIKSTDFDSGSKKTYRKLDGTKILSYNDAKTYVQRGVGSDFICKNSTLNSQEDSVKFNTAGWYMLARYDYNTSSKAEDYYVIPSGAFAHLGIGAGDVLLVIETDVPDRWWSVYGTLYQMETAKIDLNSKQDTLISGVNIKTINGQSILGEGDLEIQGGESITAGYGINLNEGEVSVDTDEIASINYVNNGLNNKQDTLIPGTNITIENNVISAANAGATNIENGSGTGGLIQLRDASKMPTFTNRLYGDLQITNDNEGPYSILLGGKGHISPDAKRAIAAGSGSVVNAGASFAIGDDNVIDTNGYGSVAAGLANKADSSYTAVFGSKNVIEGTSSYAFVSGVGNKVSNNRSKAVFGEWNYDNADTAFEIGQGSADNDRKNIFEVYKDGTVYAASLTDGTTTKTMSEVLAGGSSGATNLENGSGTKSLVQPETASFTLKDITYNVDATGKAAIVLNGKSAATGSRSFASGSSTVASGDYSHTEGVNTLASGNQSHAEGNGTIASESSTHAEGYVTQATNIAAHAEGFNTQAKGKYTHAEGNNTEASGECAHAQGHSCGAYAENSFAAGESTKAYQKNQTVVGQFNDNTKTAEILFEVGNGTNSSAKSNAFEVYKDGHAEVKVQGNTENSIVVKDYVDEALSNKQDKLTASSNINVNTIMIGNTVLDEDKLQKLLALLDTMEAE